MWWGGVLFHTIGAGDKVIANYDVCTIGGINLC